ncbi:MAG: hypothetical protein ACRYFS_10640 [Janthinobacterium lividum]
MKSLSIRIAFTVAFLLALGVSAFAEPPKFAIINDVPLPTETKLHEPMALSLNYQGDPPTKLALVVLTPDGETVNVPGKPSEDAATGKAIPVTWPFTPTESGEYRYHFEAQAGDLGSTRFPESPANDFQFVVANPLTRYVILGVGLLICFLFLPFVSYTATRSLNQRGDPAAAARIALLVGLVAYIGLAFCILTLSFDYAKWLGLALAGVVVLAILVGLFTRRRAA